MAGRTPGRCCRGVEAASKRRCASRPWAGVRPARLCEPQEHSPFILGHSLRSISALRIRGLRADRCHGELAIRSRPKIKPKAWQKHSPTHRPQSKPHARPARLENRNRFSSLKNNRSPKLAPVLRPVSASLRLRCRSAGAARHSKDGRIYSQTSPAAILAGLAECQPTEYAL